MVKKFGALVKEFFLLTVKFCQKIIKRVEMVGFGMVNHPKDFYVGRKKMNYNNIYN